MKKSTILPLSDTNIHSDVNMILSRDEVYLQLEQSVYYPANKDNIVKLPVVFLAHNGLQDKNAWGDFPQQIAKAGFFTINITWKSWDTTEVEAAIQYNLIKYANLIDINKVSFIGGCHGGKDVLQIMSHSALNYKVTSAVVLSVAEPDQILIDSQKVSHPPILAYYSKEDELGEYYQKVTKLVAEDIISAPKKVVALDEKAHGDNLVTKATNKDKICVDIIDWIKEHSK